jgi:hypothetical protein
LPRLIGDAEVLEKLQRWYADGIRKKARIAMENISAILEGYAKTHHPWTPRTGATDASTVGTIDEVTERMIGVVLTAGMNYDVFLELAREGRWAWLWPAIEANLETIKRELDGIVK